MQLKQIKIEHIAIQDRLLMRVSTDKSEVLLWLTRRCVKILWPALMGLATRTPDIALQSHPDAKSALLGMRHEEAVKKGNFSKPYEGDALEHPLGDEPILVVKIQTRVESTGKFVLTLLPDEGQGINMALDESLLHSLCKLLQNVVKGAHWDLELKLPVSGAPLAGAPVTLN